MNSSKCISALTSYNFSQAFISVDTNVAVARMINTSINATKRKHAFHRPLGDFYKNLSVEI